MTEYVLALDGGGSKTQFALADRAGAVRLSARGAGINAFDNPAWRENLASVLAPARDEPIIHAVLGIPGYRESALIDERYEAALAALWPRPHTVRNDVYMAYDAAFLDRPGVLALAGTGAMVVGRGADGQFVRAGGWGEAFGDEGGACWIGREALSRATWVADGRLDAPDFLDRFRAALGLTEGPPMYGILDWYAALKHPRSGMAGLAVHVDAMAEAGDAVALDLMDEAAMHMARQVRAGARKAGLSDPISWSHAGSVFRSGLYRRLLAEKLGAAPQAPQLPPLGGGLWLAATRAGWDPDPAWIAAIRTHLNSAA